MKTKAFDLECPGCAGRLMFTLAQRMKTRGKVSELQWPESAMVRCPACGGVATLSVLVTNAAPDDPAATITKFVKLTRG